MDAEVSPPLAFDFITDEDLRSTLTGDYQEMIKCSEVGAWKAVYVLAGSLIEAVLVDYLSRQENKGPDPLSMTFGQLISAGKKAGVLGQKSSQLSSALKEYRNLIHPGRAKRLEDGADREGAIVAQSLVRMIVGEIAIKQAKERGLTAEQISRKFASDPSAPNIADHILREASEDELKRLLLEVVPEAYFDEMEADFSDPEVLARRGTLFRAAFDTASADVKGQVMDRYVKVLREDAGHRVDIYEQEFFRGSYLGSVAKGDRQLVKEHLFSRLEDGPTELLKSAAGVGAYLKDGDVKDFVDALVRRSIRQSGSAGGELAKELLKGEYSNTPEELDPKIVERLGVWISGYEPRANSETQLRLLSEIRDAYDFPF